MTPFKISPTKLQTFLDCPRKYYFVYLKKFREPMKPALAVGQVVHNVIDAFFMLRPDLRTSDQLQNIFMTYWRAVEGQKGGFQNSVQEQESLTKALRLIDSFILITPPAITPFHHRQKLFDVPLNDQLIFQGKIDRVDELDDGLHLIDYKTGSDDYQNEWQMPMYIVMAEQRFVRPVRQAELWYLGSGKTVSVDPIQHPTQQTIKRVHEVVRQIPNTDDIRSFPCPKGGCGHCEWAMTSQMHESPRMHE